LGLGVCPKPQHPNPQSPIPNPHLTAGCFFKQYYKDKD
jgi:hypothetical protein